MTMRADLQETARRRSPDGAARSSCSTPDRCRAGDVQQPDLRPEPHRRPGLRRRPVAPRGAPRGARQPAARQRLQERYARLDVQGADHRIALDAGVVSLDSQFERVTEWTPPQTSNPIQNYDGSNCGGDLREVFRRSRNIPFAQTALNVGIPGMINGVQAWGVGERIVRRQPATRRRRARSATPTTSRIACRCWRCAASASRRTRWCPAHGDGRRRRRQQRGDDEALRRRLDVGQPRAHADPHPT